MALRFPALGVDTIIDSKQITDFGTVTLRGDLRSYAWDGGSDLSGGADSSATAGFFLDSSAGAGQFKSLFAEGIIVASAGSDIDWSYISNVSITNADIVSLSFDKITAASNGAALVIGAAGSVSSANYSTGTAGFQILGTGAAEFNNVTVRGDVVSGDWDGGTDLSAIDTTATAGFYLDSSAGAGQFSGDMFVTGRLLVRDASAVALLELGGNAGGLGLAGLHWSGLTDAHNFTLYAAGVSGSERLVLEADGSANYIRLFNQMANGITFGIDNVQVVQITASATTLSGQLLAASGTSSAPGISFSAGSGNGLRYMGSNNTRWYVAGTDVASFSAAGLATISGTSGSAANVVLGGAGLSAFARSTSARRFKSRITYNVDYLADLELAPAKFYRKDDHAWYFGFIADDLADQHPLLATYDADGVENYDQRAVLAVLAAKVNRLETEIARLKEAA